MDGDGRRDYAAVGYSPNIGMWRLMLVSFPLVLSLPPLQVIWFAEGTQFVFASHGSDLMLMDGNLDVTGDGRPDFLAISSHPAESDVYAFDNSGALLYRIPVLQYGWIALTIRAMPDLDGDGGDDFLVGCAEPTGRGAVVVVSGRSGQIARISYGLRVGDVLGGTVCNAGDVDQDGIADYAAASYFSSPLTSIVIFSGRTGVPIHSWTDFWTWQDGMLGDIDVDLDGVPDLIVGAGGWPVGAGIRGQIRAYSGRDGSVLWRLDSSLFDQFYPVNMGNLGVQPSSPYPVFAFRDEWYSVPNGTIPNAPTTRGRVIAIRTNLPGAGPVTGTPCSSTGQAPQIGMRLRIGGSRITVAKGIPGALAWLVGGPAGQTTFDGVQIPYGLDPFGLNGCSAYVAPVVVAPTVLGTTGIDRGYAAVDLPWTSLSTTGTAFAAQWLLLDAASGNYAVSARHEFRIR